MTIRGHIKGGVIVLDDDIRLPEGAPVQVQILDALATRDDEERLPTLAETLKDFIGILEDLPEDASINHDHYLYGAPKKS